MHGVFILQFANLFVYYSSNVAKRSTQHQCIYWRPTIYLASSKISNGHISATGHPIHFTFDSPVRLRNVKTKK